MLEGDEWIGRLGSGGDGGGGGPHSLIGGDEIYLLREERRSKKALVDHRYATEVESKEKKEFAVEREGRSREISHGGSEIVDEVYT